MVTPNDIWLGNWHAKIRGRIHAEGCETVTDFAKRHALLPYFKLARLIGEDVAAVQVAMMQFEEAKQAGLMREAAKDALSRGIHQHLKHGWNKGMHAKRMTAGAYAEWLSVLEFRTLAPELLPMGQAVWDALVASNPPVGWLPTGPDDPIVAAAFDRGWPTSGRSKVKRQPYGLLCPNCTGLLSSPGPEISDIMCHLCGEQIEAV